MGGGATCEIDVQKRPTTLALTLPDGATFRRGSAAPLITAELRDDRGLGLEQRPVLVTLQHTENGSRLEWRALVTTDGEGNARLTWADLAEAEHDVGRLPAGAYTVKAEFGGSSQEDGVTLNLADPRYAATTGTATASVAFTLYAPLILQAGGAGM